MDVAQREDGPWTVIELGDGQVAGLPAPELASRFYAELASALAGRACLCLASAPCRRRSRRSTFVG